jgi:diaminopimelate epimerase
MADDTRVYDAGDPTMASAIRFTKMHGIGNDYIYVDAAREKIDDPAALAKVISHRHYGVGGDGLILICPPTDRADADVRMRMFNADGSESEMCGNGIRCVCKYAHDHGLSNANPMRIETGRGVLTLQYTVGADDRVQEVTVDMGEPLWHADEVGVRVEEFDNLFKRLDMAGFTSALASRLVTSVTSGDDPAGRFTYSAEIGSEETCWRWLSMGNPHIVFFVTDVKSIALEEIGPLIETHRAFPRRINVHVVQVHSRNEITMRTWERGTGITLACGTGASAVCVAGASLDLTDREILAHLPGGDLKLRWDERTNHVFKTGPATEVFSGEWPAST